MLFVLIPAAAQPVKVDPALLQKARGDDAQTAQWYQKAADQGFANAELELALMLLAGRGVEMNESRAAVLLNRAAGKGLAQE